VNFKKVQREEEENEKTVNGIDIPARGFGKLRWWTIRGNREVDGVRGKVSDGPKKRVGRFGRKEGEVNERIMRESSICKKLREGLWARKYKA